jgi:hypothetical protein
LQVPEDEEAICSALEMESRSEKAAVDITTSSDKNKAVQKGLVMDISRVLGVLDSEKNSKPLSEQLRLVQKELVDCTHQSEKELLKTVAHLLESVVAVEPEFVRRSSTSDAGENEPLPPFEAFLCPLTKQVRLSLSLSLSLTWDVGSYLARVYTSIAKSVSWAFLRMGACIYTSIATSVSQSGVSQDGCCHFIRAKSSSSSSSSSLSCGVPSWRGENKLTDMSTSLASFAAAGDERSSSCRVRNDIRATSNSTMV